MPNRSVKLGPAIVLLFVVWTLFQKGSTSFLVATPQRFLRFSKLPFFFKVDTFAATVSNTIDVKTDAGRTSPTRNQDTNSRESGPVSSGDKKSRSPKKKSGSPGMPPRFSVDQLAALLGEALEQPVSKDDFVFKAQTFRAFHRCTLTLPLLENLEFLGAAHTSDGARETAMLLAACHAIQILGDSRSRRNPVSKLRNLVQYALGITAGKSDIVFMNRRLGDITESTLTLPILKETELREFKATGESARNAEQAAALVATRELEADLTAMGDTRTAKMYDRPPSSGAAPKARLVQLVSHALGAGISKDEVVFTHQTLGEIIEGRVTLPVLKAAEHTEFKATVQLAEGADQAEHAAAQLAFQELEPVLMARAKARMGQKKEDIA
eukprot:TRINITY_DN43619_c0_g1_i1.p1 TRINITY_DN43619_c0_g1~~TRINITY_DN43619_c0_g1_i1.p1  ORF type:complete len:382 (-),score=65.49 TRINITY_DN43619_c0_g1_i1:113-1258(-)